MATRYSYPIDLKRARGGGFSVTFPDFEEASAVGGNFAEATANAGERLEQVLAGRMARREDIPDGSPAEGRPVAVPGAVLAAKAALYEALREQRLSNSAFAVAMGIQESEVRRMLDPRHATKIGRLELALARFRKRLVVSVDEVH
ncbi:MAG: type II toxin-antitoxin system HicB family antitoxin [Rhodospirillaceae bacterium]|nr:type II toxin-antitoxin system HicB family antitoxin [Rhodospirillaceae bacterium]